MCPLVIECACYRHPVVFMLAVFISMLVGWSVFQEMGMLDGEEYMAQADGMWDSVGWMHAGFEGMWGLGLDVGWDMECGDLVGSGSSVSPLVIRVSVSCVHVCLSSSVSFACSRSCSRDATHHIQIPHHHPRAPTLPQTHTNMHQHSRTRSYVRRCWGRSYV